MVFCFFLFFKILLWFYSSIWRLQHEQWIALFTIFLDIGSTFTVFLAVYKSLEIPGRAQVQSVLTMQSEGNLTVDIARWRYAAYFAARQ